MLVKFIQNGGFVSDFSIQWNGGESGRTGFLSEGQSATVDTENLKIPDGESCWARAYIVAGPNHDSGDNFTFHEGAGNVTYTLAGSTSNPSFSCFGC